MGAQVEEYYITRLQCHPTGRVSAHRPWVVVTPSKNSSLIALAARPLLEGRFLVRLRSDCGGGEPSTPFGRRRLHRILHQLSSTPPLVRRVLRQTLLRQ